MNKSESNKKGFLTKRQGVANGHAADSLSGPQSQRRLPKLTDVQKRHLSTVQRNVGLNKKRQWPVSFNNSSTGNHKYSSTAKRNKTDKKTDTAPPKKKRVYQKRLPDAF